MMKLKLLKNILILSAFLSFSYNAMAENVRLYIKDDSMVFESSSKTKNTTFKRFNDFWIIFADKKAKLEYNEEAIKKFGVADIEKLIVKNGVGYRFRFNQNDLNIKILNDVDYPINYVKVSKTKQDPYILDRSIQFRVQDLKENTKELFLDNTFAFDYAYSYTTGEKYLIVASRDDKLFYPTLQKYNQLRFLPTYSGAAILSEDGSYLNIVELDKLQLSDKEDEFFKLAEKKLSNKWLENFYDKTGIVLLEKQERNYDFYTKSKSADGTYDNAIDKLNNALTYINSLNYLKNNANIETDTYLKDSPEVKEEAVSDSAKGLEKETVKKLFKINANLNKNPLVPDFADKDLAFMHQKLRFASIKETNSVIKDNITIKRMQINAYKKYFIENLDLNKLLRLNISGDYPENYKARALYALSNAMLNRCGNVMDLPEKADSIYTSDIKLWKAYCYTKNKRSEEAIKIYASEYSRIKTYPEYLQNYLMFNYAQALRNLDMYKYAILTLEELKEASSAAFKPEVEFALAMSYLYNNESKIAENIFKTLLYSDNHVAKYGSRLEYLNILLHDPKANKADIINALEDIRFDYRGTAVELSATETLASLYLQEKNVRKAMELYKYISIYFPKTHSAKIATDALFNIFYNLFEKNQKVNRNLNDINRLAIFYDFIELIPSDYAGNRIINNVVADLTRLQLLNKAKNLLTIQLNYKLKNPDIIEKVGIKLAKLYVDTGELDNAISILNLTQIEKKDLNYLPQAKIIKAKALIGKNNTKDAEDLLLSIKGNLIDAKYMLSNIYWNENNYKKIIKTLERTFLGKKVKLHEDDIINLTYLLVAYSLEKNPTKIKQIKSFYLPELRRVNLEYKVDFLLKLAGEDIKIQEKDDKLIDIWQTVIQTDNKVNDFMSDYEDNANFRKAFEARDYETLINKYQDRLE